MAFIRLLVEVIIHCTWQNVEVIYKTQFSLAPSSSREQYYVLGAASYSLDASYIRDALYGLTPVSFHNK